MDNMRDVHAHNVGKIAAESRNAKAYKANLRSDFLEEDNYVITQVLKRDMMKHMANEDVEACIPVTYDSFVNKFLEKICNVYDTAPVFKFSKKVNDAQKERFSALMQEVRINQIMQGNNLKMRLHNCILNFVRYNADLNRVYIENDYTIGTSKVFTFPTYQYEARVITYETYTARNDKIWVVWDRIRKEHYYCTSEPEENPDTGEITAEDKKPIIGNKDMISPNYWPWVIYRYREHNGDFWGNGMDWLINLCRVINLMLTITNDDAFQQNLRILIMNFEPIGTMTEDEYPENTASKNKRLKVGMKYPVFPKESKTYGAKDGEKADAKIVQAELFLDSIVDFVQNLTEMAGAMHGVDSAIKRDIESSLSGIALAIRNQPLLSQWSKDIEIMRPFDRQLIKTIIEVNNYHRAIQNKDGIAQKTNMEIDPAILDEMTIEYQRPHVITDEKAEYELERMKWEDGTSSPVHYVMKRYPDMDEDAAQEFIQKNLKDIGDLGGISVKLIPANDKPDGEVEENDEDQ